MAGELPNARIPELDEAVALAAGDFFVIYQAITGVTKKIAASAVRSTSDQNFNWVSNFEYGEDEAVIYGDRWYVSLQDTNEGHLPTEADSEWWELISKSITGGYWAAGVFTEDNVVVLYDDIDGFPHWIKLTDAAVRPFVSSDLQAEYLAGKWIRIERSMQLMDTPFDASGNNPPNSLTAGSGPGGLILQGNNFLIGVAAANVDLDILVDATVIAKVDNPGADWSNYKINRG